MACVVTLRYEVKWDRRIDEVPDTPEECALPEGSRGRACSHKWCKVRAWQFLSEGARRLEDESEEIRRGTNLRRSTQTWGGALPPGTTGRVLGQIGNFRVGPLSRSFCDRFTKADFPLLIWRSGLELP